MIARLKIIDNAEIQNLRFIGNISKSIQSHHVEGVTDVARLKSTLNFGDSSSQHVSTNLSHYVRTFLCSIKLN